MQRAKVTYIHSVLNNVQILSLRKLHKQCKRCRFPDELPKLGGRNKELSCRQSGTADYQRSRFTRLADFAIVSKHVKMNATFLAFLRQLAVRIGLLHGGIDSIAQVLQLRSNGAGEFAEVLFGKHASH
jgi:hypothetical protein